VATNLTIFPKWWRNVITRWWNDNLRWWNGNFRWWNAKHRWRNAVPAEFNHCSRHYYYVTYIDWRTIYVHFICFSKTVLSAEYQTSQTVINYSYQLITLCKRLTWHNMLVVSCKWTLTKPDSEQWWCTKAKNIFTGQIYGNDLVYCPWLSRICMYPIRQVWNSITLIRIRLSIRLLIPK